MILRFSNKAICWIPAFYFIDLQAVFNNFQSGEMSERFNVPDSKSGVL